MPNAYCYERLVHGWPTNDGGQLINDPRLYPQIIPELESEVIEIGLCPRRAKEVPPGTSLDLAQVVAVWDERHITVARMYWYGMIETRRHILTLQKLRAKKGKLTPEDYTAGRRVSADVQIFTRAKLEACVKQGRILAYSPTHRPLDVITGCMVFIHTRTG
jgi:hypothetical protein